MKKFLSIVLAVVMVLSMAVTAFAASIELWAENADVSASTSALNAMYAAGILKGDGDKAPSASATLTRWQVALIALRLYTLVDEDGMENYDLDDANWANYVVDFGDVDVKYEDCEYPEALGAILFVQEKGFILGYAEDDKTYFKPTQPVTYAEALTIMVRILGWDSKAMNLNWPYNYVAQAAKLGLTTDITKIGMNDQVTYGVMAQLVYNVLNANYYVSAEKLSASFLGQIISQTEFGYEMGREGYGDYVLDTLATAEFHFLWVNAEGELVECDHCDVFTFIKNVGKVSLYVEDRWGNKGGDLDFSDIYGDDEDGYAVLKKQYEIEAPNGDILVKDSSSDYRVVNWFWYFYTFEYDADGNIVLDEESRTAALTLGQMSKNDGSANAWYTKAVAGKNMALVCEPMADDEDLFVINVNGEIYLAHADSDFAGEYNEVFDETYAEFIEKKFEEFAESADKALIANLKTIANVYFRAGVIYGGGGFAGNPDMSLTDDDGPYFWEAKGEAHINNWSLNKLAQTLGMPEMMLTEAENEELIRSLESASGVGFGSWDAAWEDDSYGGLDGLANSRANVLKLYTSTSDWGTYVFDAFAEPSGVYAWTVEHYVEMTYAAEAEAAAYKAANKALKNELSYMLDSIPTDVAGKEFLAWSNPVYIGENEIKFEETGYVDVATYAINALYEADYSKNEWVGEEKTLGSYVVNTTVKEGFKYVEQYAAELVELADLGEVSFAASVEYIGVCNDATYGAWVIDTNGDGYYDVCVYANFVTLLAE